MASVHEFEDRALVWRFLKWICRRYRVETQKNLAGVKVVEFAPSTNPCHCLKTPEFEFSRKIEAQTAYAGNM
jgi:hypothetical protein